MADRSRLFRMDPRRDAMYDVSLPDGDGAADAEVGEGLGSSILAPLAAGTCGQPVCCNDEVAHGRSLKAGITEGVEGPGW